MPLTEKQKAKLKAIRKELRSAKTKLGRLAKGDLGGDIDDASGYVEDALECIGAAFDNDREE